MEGEMSDDVMRAYSKRLEYATQTYCRKTPRTRAKEAAVKAGRLVCEHSAYTPMAFYTPEQDAAYRAKNARALQRARRLIDFALRLEGVAV